MSVRGYLATRMTGAFQMLRSTTDLVARRARLYDRQQFPRSTSWLECGRDPHALPHASQYLRALFLDNDLAEGRLMDPRPVELRTYDYPSSLSAPKPTILPPGTRFLRSAFSPIPAITFVLTLAATTPVSLTNRAIHGGISAGSRAKPVNLTSIPTRGSPGMRNAMAPGGRHGPHGLASDPANRSHRLRSATARPIFRPLEDAPGRYVFAK